MGFELRREVVGILPRGGVLTDKECRLILELADNCHEKNRTGWPGAEWLADRCDIPKPKRVGEFFASIGRKWFELRVEIGKDRHGKPYYSTPTKRVTYKIPTRAELLEACPDKVPPTQGLSPCEVPATEGPKVPATGGPKVPPTQGARSPQQGDPFPQGFPQEDPQIPPPSPGVAEAVAAEPMEGGGDEISSKPTAEQTAAAERLMEPYYDDLISKQRRRLGAYLAAALDAGWAEGDLEKELAAPTAGLRDVGAGLIGRIRDLDTPPANRGPALKICGSCGGEGEAWIEMFQTTAPCPDCAGTGRVEPAPPDDSPCPLHTTYKWHHCNCCWGDVKAGNDPFVHDLQLRPDGWLEIYKKQELAEERERDRRRARGEFVPYRDPVDPARYLEKL